MFDRFTDKSRELFNQARNEAWRLNDECIDTEHILLGLTLLEYGTAREAIERLGHDIESVRARVNESVQEKPPRERARTLPFESGGKRVLELALESASSMDANEISSIHVLIGLVLEPQGVAGRVLRKLGITAEAILPEAAEWKVEHPTTPRPTAARYLFWTVVVLVVGTLAAIALWRFSG